MRTKIIIIVTITAILLAGKPFNGSILAQAFIVEDGNAKAEIIIAEDPPRMTALAALELQYYLEKISGARLPITHEPGPEFPVKIYVGESEYTGDRGMDAVGLEYGAFRMVSGSDWLVLLGQDEDYIPSEPWSRGHYDIPRALAEWDVLTTELANRKWGFPFSSMFKSWWNPGDYNSIMTGRYGMENKNIWNPRDLSWSREYQGPGMGAGFWIKDRGGTLNAVYGFLKSLGARWYMPGKTGEILPGLATISLPGLDTTEQPDFSVRSYFWYNYSGFPLKDILWARQTGMNTPHEVIGDMGYAHGHHFVFSRTEMKTAHPEYYALIDGVRDTAHRGYGTACYTSAGLADETVKFARFMFDHFDQPHVSIWPVDGYKQCECDSCQGKSPSELVWSFVDKVARELYESHPDRLVSCGAYAQYKPPPGNINEFTPNVLVFIANERRPGFNDQQRWESYWTDLQKWRDRLAPGRIMRTENNLYSTKWGDWGFDEVGQRLPIGFPVIHPHAMARDIQALEGISTGESGEVSQREQTWFSPGIDHLPIYVQSQFLWDAGQDVDSLLNEYYMLFYGPASEEMKAVVEFAEANYEYAESNFWCFTHGPWRRNYCVEHMDLSIRNHLLELLKTARDSVRKPVHAERIQMIINEMLASSDNAFLSAITWPDMPVSRKGWNGDTIPLFDRYKTAYRITLPAGTSDVPHLLALPSDINARVTEDRATFLKGDSIQRTTTFSVTAEDGITTREYSVVFEVEIPEEKRQLYRAEPIFTEHTWIPQTAWCTEIYNPGDIPIDLSRYRIYCNPVDAPLSPEEAIGLDPPDDFLDRYLYGFTPGMQYTHREENWEAQKGYLMPDSLVDPVVDPGEVFMYCFVQAKHDIFTAEDKWMSMRDHVLPHVNIIPNYSENWILNGGWNLNTWGLTNVDDRAGFKGLRVYYLFKILNDSILDGKKPVGDPGDFDLIDFLGDPSAGSWPEVWMGGKRQADFQNNNRQIQFIRKPQYWQANDDLDSVHMQVEWTARSDEEPDVQNEAKALGVPVRYFISMNLGVHNSVFGQPITSHLSTVSSVVYLVSDGYESPQSIQGELTETTMVEFLGSLIKVDTAQELRLFSAIDGREKGTQDTIVAGDSLVVVSADGKNKTMYVLINEPLDDDALLRIKPEYSDMYVIDIEGQQGSISGSGISWGKPLKEILAAVIKPPTATLSVIDNKGELVPNQVMNYDGEPVDVRAGDSIYLEVVAQNKTSKILYRLVPASSPGDAYVISSVFRVDQESMNISQVPEGIHVHTFLFNIQASTGASAQLVNMFGIERNIGQLALDDKLKVVSEDGTRTVYYYIDFFDEVYPDHNIAPVLKLGLIDTNIVINETITLASTVLDDGMPKPVRLNILWEVISGDTGYVHIADPDRATTEATFSGLGSFVLQITANDGELVTRDKVALLVTSGTGLEESRVPELRMYPNPVSRLLTLELNNTAEKAGAVKVFSLTGTTVFIADYNQHKMRVNVSDLDAGVYFVTIEAGEYRVTGKLLILPH